MSEADAFLKARDFLIDKRVDYDAAYHHFDWPRQEYFNWALDYFDGCAQGNNRTALWIVGEPGAEQRLTFAELSERSNRVANFLRGRGVGRGDRILVMVGNVAALWEVTLAAMKLGALISPTSLLLTQSDLRDRVERGAMRHIIAEPSAAENLAELPGLANRLVVGDRLAGWTPYEEAYSAAARFEPDALTRADDPFFLYFTSGTAAKPKMVLHSHQSYPVGHLSTMYWIGLKEGDVHYNISSPGWAKHAWSSFFAPWNAGATVFTYNLPRFDAKKTLDAIVRYGVTTLCAPPTVWRMMILEDLRSYPVKLREVVAAGEPLNPEVIERVRSAWGITIRDGYGQTESTALVGNTPGQPVKQGSMGRPLPGYRLAPLDAEGRPTREGEIAVSLQPRPVGLMSGYDGSPEQTAAALGGSYYRTGDVAGVDEDGYYWFVGRADDVFKSSDYRISPFELESTLIEHQAVAEAAVVPSPDARRLSVAKGYIVLKPGYEPNRETAASIFRFTREHLAPYKRLRRLEFAELPKTISGKIRRTELRQRENERGEQVARGVTEFWEEDLAE